jgi:hypothetical protein
MLALADERERVREGIHNKKGEKVREGGRKIL